MYKHHYQYKYPCGPCLCEYCNNFYQLLPEKQKEIELLFLKKEYIKKQREIIEKYENSLHI